MRTRLSCVVATFDLAPLQGAPRGTVFPGLKPRAEPSRPLRGEETAQTLPILVPFSHKCYLCPDCALERRTANGERRTLNCLEHPDGLGLSTGQYA
jgi:hypothetical protein